MFEINTEKLRLIPLDIENYRLYIDNSSKLYEKLDLQTGNHIVEEPVKSAHEFMFNKLNEGKQDYMWQTNWIVVLKEEKCIIGGIMIKGVPNDKGEVILGYGTDKNYQSKGYMTEALKGLIKWIFQNPDVLSIIADTDKNNIPSHRVLEKSGFIKYKETKETNDEGEIEELTWWKLDK